MIIDEIREELFRLQDVEYRDFQSKLIPTADPGFFIGVRTPELRKLAKQLAGRADIGEFLAALPHAYFDENQLHAFIISEFKDYEKCLAAVEHFLPYVDNWATCDQMSPKVFKKHREELLPIIKRWLTAESTGSAERPTAASIASAQQSATESTASVEQPATNTTYTVRFGIGMLMAHYLDDAFDPAYPELVASVRSEEYYIRMMVAWYFATALAKQYEAVIPYIEECRLDPWTHNKTIQKAIESYRITPEQKDYLRGLKVKVR